MISVVACCHGAKLSSAPARIPLGISDRNTIKQILLICFILFPIRCLRTEGSSQSIEIQQKSGPFSGLARCETQDLYNTDKSDMNESQSWTLPSLNFLRADLTWLEMYLWLFLLHPCLHSDETRYNLNNWCFWLLNILNLLNKSNHKWL